MSDKERLDSALNAIDLLSAVLTELSGGAHRMAQQHAALFHAVCFLSGELRAQGICDGQAMAERAIAQMRSNLGSDEEREKLLRALLLGIVPQMPPMPSAPTLTVIQGGKDDAES